MSSAMSWWEAQEEFNRMAKNLVVTFQFKARTDAQAMLESDTEKSGLYRFVKDYGRANDYTDFQYSLVCVNTLEEEG